MTVVSRQHLQRDRGLWAIRVRLVDNQVHEIRRQPRSARTRRAAEGYSRNQRQNLARRHAGPISTRPPCRLRCGTVQRSPRRLLQEVRGRSRSGCMVQSPTGMFKVVASVIQRKRMVHSTGRTDHAAGEKGGQGAVQSMDLGLQRSSVRWRATILVVFVLGRSCRRVEGRAES